MKIKVILGLINQTYMSVEDRMTHHKVFIFLFFSSVKLINFQFDKVVMGHAILTKPIDLVNKTMENFIIFIFY